MEPTSTAKALAQAAPSEKSRHHVIPHAGHDLPQEEPEAFAAAVLELVGA